MAEAATTTFRVRYRAFVAHHEVAWELSFAALAAVFVALAFVPVTPGSSADQALFALEWVITGVFIAEFTSRLWAAESRRGYVRGHWIDLVSCIPPVRWARFFRLFRLLRLVRTFAGIGRAMTHVERLAQSPRPDLADHLVGRRHAAVRGRAVRRRERGQRGRRRAPSTPCGGDSRR